MTRVEERYGFIPVLLKRLFTWGLLASALFFVLWYMGGMHVWASVVTFLIKTVTLFQLSCNYDSGQEAIIVLISVSSSKPVEIGYYANQWNVAIAEVVLLSSLWWSRSRKKKHVLLLACIGLLFLYQVLTVLLNVSVQALGPDLPNQLGIMWEHEGSLLYLALRKAQLFETFIARYWSGFPVFGVAILIWMGSHRTGGKKRTKSKKTA